MNKYLYIFYIYIYIYNITIQLVEIEKFEILKLNLYSIIGTPFDFIGYLYKFHKL